LADLLEKVNITHDDEYEYHVLVIDDDPGILDLISGMLSDSYTMHLFKEPKLALEFFKGRTGHQKMSVVISDLRMPGLNGVDLLNHCRDHDPSALRLLLTGYSDTQAVIRAINETHIFQFIQKPIKEEDLRLTMHHAIKAWSLSKSHHSLVTDLKNLNAQLEAKVEERTRETQNLLRIICHDLATPASVINGSVHRLILKPNGDKEFRDKQIARIEFAGKSISEILHHVIAMQAFASNKRPMALKNVSVQEALDHCVILFKDQLEAKGVSLVLDIEENTITKTDSAVLRHHILGNLISNAIKFSYPDGHITVTSRVHWEEGEISIKVRDSGIGIPPGIMEKLFSSKDATSRKGTNGERGTGFGMPIVKSTLEKLSGTIKVESRDVESFPKNSGTTFEIRLPMAATKKFKKAS